MRNFYINLTLLNCCALRRTNPGNAMLLSQGTYLKENKRIHDMNLSHIVETFILLIFFCPYSS